jgi:Na+-transporting NADH:ubiquinone oxidoreductase subunit D
MVDIAFRAYFPEIHKDIAASVGLIITNCIVLGRLEAYASKNRPLPALFDGLGAGLGYSVILIAIATVREYLGFGSLLGFQMPIQPHQWTIMVTPPGAFFLLALAVWAARSYDLRREKKAEQRKVAAAAESPAQASGGPS